MFNSMRIHGCVTPGSQRGLLPEISNKPMCIDLTISFYYLLVLCHISTISLPFQSTLFSPIDVIPPPPILYPYSPCTIWSGLYDISETYFTCNRISLLIVQVSVTCFVIFFASIAVNMVLWYLHIILVLKKSLLTSQPLSY